MVVDVVFDALLDSLKLHDRGVIVRDVEGSFKDGQYCKELEFPNRYHVLLARNPEGPLIAFREPGCSQWSKIPPDSDLRLALMKIEKGVNPSA